MGVELDNARGWPARVAERTGLSLSYVRKLDSGERTGVTVDILDRVRARMNIDQRFFFDEALGSSPNYRDFVQVRAGSSSEPRATDPPHWAEFVDRYEHLDELTAEQLEDIKRFAARNLSVRSWTDFERVAEIVRTSRPSPTFEEKKAKRRK